MPEVIGQFNDSFAPIADGVGNVVKNYAYWLKKKQYCDCYVVTPSFPGYVDNEEFEVLRYRSVPVPLRYPYRAGMALFDQSLRNKLRNIRFDLIHAHSPFSSGRLALGIARSRGIPIVATFHSKYFDDFKEAVKSAAAAKLLLKYVMSFFNSVDCVWTVSKTAVETLREYGFKGCVEVVGHGTDFSGEEISKEKCGDGCLRLLYVGQQVWHKNIRLMVLALKMLKDSGLKFKMTMVGEGNAQQSIKRFVQRMGLADDFTFMGKITDRDAMKTVYASADLNLLPSVYDTFSLVVREAAAFGCPSLVIKGSCAAEGIEDGRNGFLSDNDAAAFASRIQKAASDLKLLRAAGAKARNTLYRSWEDVVDEVAMRYADIIKGTKQRIFH
ncbi:MAG: glycosyltransferase [Burkholderiales bacterium]